MKTSLITLSILALFVCGVFSLWMQTQNQVTSLGVSTRSGKYFIFDDSIVERISINYDNNTATVYLKDGRSRTFPFSWDSVEAFEAAAKTNFAK